MKKKAKRGRGRPIGSKGKKKEIEFYTPYLIDVELTCKHCKRDFIISTQKKGYEERYTKEVKANAWCGLCKKQPKAVISIKD